jgi:hypothetical protein
MLLNHKIQSSIQSWLINFELSQMLIEKLKQCLAKIDPKKATEMLIGVSGIYFSFLLSGIFYEKITNNQYTNSRTGFD